jgi:hypothetical protein
MKIHSMIYSSTTTPINTNAMKIRALSKSNTSLKGALAFLLIFLLTGCFNESKVDVAKPNTFVRSYSNGYDIETVQVEQTPDGGFIILGNTEKRNSEAEAIEYKIVLIKTDQYGNELNMTHYPDINNNGRNLSANSILLLPGGYLISATEIEDVDVNTGEITQYKPLLMEVDAINHSVTLEKDYSGAFNAKAVSATLNPANSNSYLVLYSSEDPVNSVAVSEIDPTDLSVNWSRSYEGKQTLLANRIFYKAGTTDYLFFGGTATRSNRNDGRLIQVKLDEQFTESDLDYKADNIIDSDETIVDLCQFGSGFAMIGKTNLNGNDDIFFLKLNSSGNASDTATFVDEILADKNYNNPKDTANFLNAKNETGKSISPVSDGGIIILGTIDSYGDPVPLGAGNTDMLLMKINAFGERQWARTLGGLDADDGTCVRQTSDGGFIVLGTTRLGARGTILLVKTDKLGDVD